MSVYQLYFDFLQFEKSLLQLSLMIHFPFLVITRARALFLTSTRLEPETSSLVRGPCTAMASQASCLSCWRRELALVARWVTVLPERRPETRRQDTEPSLTASVLGWRRRLRAAPPTQWRTCSAWSWSQPSPA